MLEYLKLFLLINNIYLIWATEDVEEDELNTKAMTAKNFLVWPNATIPFYIDPSHFDTDQAMAIMTALSMFAFKTCLKFLPVLETPQDNRHIMVFVNPNGDKKCKINTNGHSVYKNHNVTLGYECLKSPHIDMMIMKALGFPFEHNRLSRDLYINVLLQNIEPEAIELFTKDVGLPVELRAQPYDINSVMHFGEREYSKNGHKTIAFKSANSKQNRIGLTETDLKKIDIVYGNECRKRDREEKIELCQSFPGVNRRKRETETGQTLKSLRVNPNITPPSIPAVSGTEDKNAAEVYNNLKTLGVEDEAQKVVDQVFKLSGAALRHAREKYCNNSKAEKPGAVVRKDKSHTADITGILGLVNEYTVDVVEKALSNLTVFCEKPDTPEAYQRACNWRFDSWCRPNYRSTKSGPVHYSTQHRPIIAQSTNIDHGLKYSYDHHVWRSGNETEELSTTPQELSTTPQEELSTAPQARKKREAPEPKKTSSVKEKLQKEKKKTAAGSNGDKRRYFERLGFKTTKQANKSEAEWAASDVSSEKGKETPKSEFSEKKKGDSREVIMETYNFGLETKPIIKRVSTDQEDSGQEEPNFIKSKNKLNIKDSFELMDKKSEKKTKSTKKKKSPREVPETVKLTKLNKEFYNERRWPEGIVRYVISSQEEYDVEDMRARLAKVADILKEKTCVTLQEVTEEEAINHEDYLVIDTSPDYVTGRVGGQQHFGSIELFKGGQHKQHTAMMVMAMLGFYFEVSRHDREKYIRVHMRHVRPDKLHHFEKIRDEATLDLPYDYKSATHPAWQFWRKIGKTGISTVATFKDRDPDGSIMRKLGQHDQLLSDIDIIKINSIYGVECFTE